MKNLLLIAAGLFLCSTTIMAQTQTINGQLKLKNVPLGSSKDSILVIGDDGSVRHLKSTELPSTTKAGTGLRKTGNSLKLGMDSFLSNGANNGELTDDLYLIKGSFLNLKHSALGITDDQVILNSGSAANVFSNLSITREGTFSLFRTTASGTQAINARADGSFFITDEIQKKGLEYIGDYEKNFSSRSLVSKNYVDLLLLEIIQTDTSMVLPVKNPELSIIANGNVELSFPDARQYKGLKYRIRGPYANPEFSLKSIIINQLESSIYGDFRSNLSNLEANKTYYFQSDGWRWRRVD